MSDKPTRKHDFEIVIDASPEEVWKAITEGERIQQWFAPEVRVEPGLDGHIFMSWGPGMEGSAPLSIWEPGRRIGWTEHSNSANPRVVEFIVEGEGGQTRLRLVHSGFGADSSFDGEYDSTHGGWLTFLAALRYYAERKSGVPGRNRTRLAFLQGASTEWWAKLTGAIQLGDCRWQPGEPYTATLPDGHTFHGVVYASPKPGYGLLEVAELDGSLLGLFAESFGGQCSLTTTWYLYGDAAVGDGPLLAAWDTLFQQLTERAGEEQPA
jgi:uncharacterized protein YndB with AHSA1/START domain